MIKSLSLNEFGAMLGEHSSGGRNNDIHFDSVSIDTRTLAAGDLYIAISGDNFDGDDFVEQAVAAGAVGAVVSRDLDADIPLLPVANGRHALGVVAAYNRDQYAGKVAAVTGSAGKTTVKEMTANILRQCGEVLATRGNFNNDIGVPLTLLELAASHDYAVLELGASSIGEIAYTVDLVRPDVSILTNAADAHIEGFGSLSNIVQAKGEIIDGLKDDGTAIINADDLNAYKWLQRAGDRNTLTFSLDADSGADFYADNLQLAAGGGYDFDLVTPQGSERVSLYQLGEHNVRNALAAAAAAMTLGATLDQVSAGLQSVQPVNGRLVRKTGLAGARLIDDSYNANPESLKAAIRVLAQIDGVRVLVLGDMAELGEETVQAHRECGAYARAQGIDVLLSCGVLSAHASQAFNEGEATEGQHFTDQAALVEHLTPLLNKQTTVLIKGSRSAHMEDVVAAISEHEEDREEKGDTI